MFGNQPSTLQSGGTTTLDTTGATRRDYYEMTGQQQTLPSLVLLNQHHAKSASPWSSTQASQSSPQGAKLDTESKITSLHGPSQYIARNTEGEKRLGKQPGSARKGYWDVLSIFRSGNRSTTQTRQDSES